MTSTTTVSINFDTNHLKLTNMIINYNNDGVAISDNAELSIVPLIPPPNNTYNIMAPTITYQPNPRTVLANSTESTIYISENDADCLINNNIPTIDFNTGSTVVSLDVGDTVNLIATPTSSTAISLIDTNCSNIINSLLTSLGQSTNDNTFIYQDGAYLFIFIPYNNETVIYVSNILSNGIVTIPTLTNASIPVEMYSASVFINNGYMYVCGANNNITVQCYYAAYSAGDIGSFTLNATSIPALTVTIPPYNSLGYSAYTLIANLFAIQNNYIYILGNVGNDFGYAYATLNTDGSIGAWTTETSIFPTTSSTYTGIASTQIYNNVLYISGLLVYLAATTPGGGTAYYTESYNLYTATFNADGTINPVTAFTYPSNVYYISPNIYISDNVLYLFNAYTSNQTFASGSGLNFENPGPIYYSNINIDGSLPNNWAILSSSVSYIGPFYYVKLNSGLTIYSNSDIKFIEFNYSFTTNLISVVPSNSIPNNSVSTGIIGSLNGIYNNNSLYLVQDGNSGVLQFQINNQYYLSQGGNNVIPTPTGSTKTYFINGFIYNNIFYLISQTYYDAGVVNSTNSILGYPINSYGNFGSPVTLNTPPAALENLTNISPVVINNVVYIFGGIDYTAIPNDTSGNTLCEPTTSTAVSTTFTATINSDGTLGSWSTLSLNLPPLSFSTNIINVNNEYLLGVGYDGKLYSSVITNNIPGDFAVIDSSLTYDEHMFSLLYLNGILFLGFYANTTTNTLNLYYTNFSSNTISGWKTINTSILTTYYPSMFYNANNNSVLVFDNANNFNRFYYINNENLTYTLVPTTPFTAIPTNYYFNNLNVAGMVGSATNYQNYSKLSLSSSTFNNGIYTLSYNPIENTMSGLNCYLTISNIYNQDIISEIQLSVQGRQYTLPPIS